MKHFALLLLAVSLAVSLNAQVETSVQIVETHPVATITTSDFIISKIKVEVLNQEINGAPSQTIMLSSPKISTIALFPDEARKFMLDGKMLSSKLNGHPKDKSTVFWEIEGVVGVLHKYSAGEPIYALGTTARGKGIILSSTEFDKVLTALQQALAKLAELKRAAGE
jgi:hypothetical protein